MSTILIQNARIIDPASGLDQIGDLRLEDGLITGVAESDGGQETDRRIDATGLVAAPGLIDLYARLREPGQEKKATIDSETRAALYNGITSLVCSPDTEPVIDETTTVELIHRKARDAGFARVYPLAALTRSLNGTRLSELATLREAGCVAASQADRPLNNTLVLRRAMDYARTFDIVLMLAPVDDALTADGCAHEGRVATRLGLPAIPAAAETVALSVLIELCYQTRARLHLSRITTARGVRLIAEARQHGLPITADTGINHLFFDETASRNFDSLMRTTPPFRSREDQQALRQAVIDGTLDAVCSDHAPHDLDAKLAPYPAAEPGLSSLDSFLGLLLRFGHESGLSLPATLAPATSGPARALGLPGGRLEPGMPADILLLDPDAQRVLDAGSFYSNGQNSPWFGHSLPGVIRQVFCRGRQYLPETTAAGPQANAAP